MCKLNIIIIIIKNALATFSQQQDSNQPNQVESVWLKVDRTNQSILLKISGYFYSSPSSYEEVFVRGC